MKLTAFIAVFLRQAKKPYISLQSNIPTKQRKVELSLITWAGTKEWVFETFVF